LIEDLFWDANHSNTISVNFETKINPRDQRDQPALKSPADFADGAEIFLTQKSC
jgi:hypothetical protein